MLKFKDEEKLMELIAPEIKPIKVAAKVGHVLVARPSLKDYRRFEADFASLLVSFLPLFSGISFLSYEDYRSLTMKNNFLVQLQKAIVDIKFVNAFKRMLSKHSRIYSFHEGLTIRNIDTHMTPSQVAYLFLITHYILTAEKKSQWETASEVLGQRILSDFSIFSSTSSDGAGPKFGTLM